MGGVPKNDNHVPHQHRRVMIRSGMRPGWVGGLHCKRVHLLSPETREFREPYDGPRPYPMAEAGHNASCNRAPPRRSSLKSMPQSPLLPHNV